MLISDWSSDVCSSELREVTQLLTPNNPKAVITHNVVSSACGTATHALTFVRADQRQTIAGEEESVSIPVNTSIPITVGSAPKGVTVKKNVFVVSPAENVKEDVKAGVHTSYHSEEHHV